VYWRLGGAGGTKQRCTFGSEKLALRAKEIAEAHRHRITNKEVETILGITESPEKPRTSNLPTVREWATVWLDSRTRIGPDQRRRVRSQLDRIILPAIGDLHLDHVSGVDVVEILKSILAAGSTPTTVTRYFATIFSLFNYAVKEKKIDDNPAKRTDFVRDLIASDDADDDGEDHVYLTRAEYRMIWNSMAPMGRPVLDLLIGTGARWSEATAVLVSGFHPGPKPAAHVKIHRAWKRDERGKRFVGPTKGRNKRVVTVAAHTVKILRPLRLAADRKTARPGDALLLTATQGGRLNYDNFRNRYWNPAVGLAMRCADHPPPMPAKTWNGQQRKLRPDEVSTCDCEGRLRRRPTLHDLRHTHVAWLIAARQPIAAISRRVGHRTTEITEVVYGGIMREVQEAMADAIDAVFSDPVDEETGADEPLS
jgi:integrase